jgi:hypothetical protein
MYHALDITIRSVADLEATGVCSYVWGRVTPETRCGALSLPLLRILARCGDAHTSVAKLFCGCDRGTSAARRTAIKRITSKLGGKKSSTHVCDPVLYLIHSCYWYI